MEYLESWEEFMVKGTERKAILCTSPSSGSKLTVVNIQMQPLFTTLLGRGHSL